MLKKILKKIKFYYLKVKFILLNKKNTSYNNRELNQLIYKKTILLNKIKLEIQDSNYLRTVNFAKFINKNNLTKVLDMGGGAGYHYFIVKKLFPSLISEWTIIENKTMVRLCNNLTIFKNLFFRSNFKINHKVDIFFSSCAINYLNNPINTLKKISRINCKYFFFTRMPLSTDKYIKFDQYSLLSDNGPIRIHVDKDKIVKLTNKIIPIKTFEKIFSSKKGFKVIECQIDDEKFSQRRIPCYTYIIKKINL